MGGLPLTPKGEMEEMEAELMSYAHGYFVYKHLFGDWTAVATLRSTENIYLTFIIAQIEEKKIYL